MEYKITKTDLNKAKEKVLREFLDNRIKKAEETTKEIFQQFKENKMGEVPSEEEINAKRNRK